MSKRKRKFGDPVEFAWSDVVEIAGWKTLDDCNKAIPESYCKTKGYFVKEDDEFIWIAHTIGQDKTKDMCGLLMIPKRVIKK